MRTASSRPPSPGSLEPVTAWRVWRVVRRRGGLLLASVAFDDEWPPGEPLAAACRAGHAAPDPRCACGVHGLRDPDGLERYLVGRREPNDVCRLVGEVSLWGQVLEGELGWRAERGYPRRLLVPRGLPAHELAAYGVPVLAGVGLPRARA